MGKVRGKSYLGRGHTQKFSLFCHFFHSEVKIVVTHGIFTPERNVFHFRSEKLFCGHTQNFHFVFTPPAPAPPMTTIFFQHYCWKPHVNVS